MLTLLYLSEITDTGDANYSRIDSANIYSRLGPLLKHDVMAGLNSFREFVA
jgi:hypothetical protein